MASKYEYTWARVDFDGDDVHEEFEVVDSWAKSGFRVKETFGTSNDKIFLMEKVTVSKSPYLVLLEKFLTEFKWLRYALLIRRNQENGSCKD